jgi:molybdopterin-containing oxidoreductase family membrane subunit
VLVLGIPWFRSVNSVTIVSVLILIGLWAKRYMIVVPTLETPFLPVQDTRMDWVNYSPSWVELSLTVSGFALIILIFTIASRIAPILPVAEMQETHDDVPAMLTFKTKGV